MYPETIIILPYKNILINNTIAQYTYTYLRKLEFTELFQ